MMRVRMVLDALRKAMARLATGADESPGVPQQAPFVRDLAEAYTSGWSRCPCVFVLSTGRVGTQTLTALLNLSPQVLATHEPEPSLVQASFAAYMEGEAAAGSEKWRAVVLAARDDFVLRASKQGKIYAETSNRLSYLAPALAAAFPASRFIHLHRHPHEVIRSAMRRRHYQGHAWDFARIRPRPESPLAEGWSGMSPLEKTAWYWAEVNALAIRFLKGLPPMRALDLPAEVLFAGNPKRVAAAFSFIGAAPPPEGAIQKVLDQKLNAHAEADFRGPADWTREDLRTISRLVGTTAEALGYEV